MGKLLDEKDKRANESTDGMSGRKDGSLKFVSMESFARAAGAGSSNSLSASVAWLESSSDASRLPSDDDGGNSAVLARANINVERP